jgi:acetyltransferase-like isoleucine patch superfamily enzyme
MKISICLATYNGEKYIKELIDSILLQLDEDSEIVVSDDGSIDGTIQILLNYNDNRIKIYTDNKNKGVVGNFENAIKYSKGEYIFLCDQDDVWLPYKIDMCIKYLERNILVVTDCFITDANLKIIEASFFKKYSSRAGFFKNLYKNTYLGACICFKRELLKIILPIPKTLPVYHEGWIASLADIIDLVYFLPVACIYYRRHENTTSHTAKGKGLPFFCKIFNRFYFLCLIIGRLIFWYFKKFKNIIYNQYQLIDNIYLAICFVRTKMCFANAKLIRFPIDIRNKHLITIGRGFITGRGCRLEVGKDIYNKDSKLVIGNNVQINDYVHISAWENVTIGNNVLIASKVYISDVTHGSFKKNHIYNIEIPPINQPLCSRAVSIGNNVWIGESVSILPGIVIGNYCVIGANSVVTKDIPSNCMVIGNPARIVKRYCYKSKTWRRVDINNNFID